MKKRHKSEIYLWMPLIGFDVSKEDNGVDEYIEKLGFTPGGISLFVFNPDIVHLHEQGMKEKTLLQRDNCNYFGSIRNEEREIQQWTNYDLRNLCRELRKRGISSYLGIMGIETGEGPGAKSFFSHCVTHQKWLAKHKELMCSFSEKGTMNLNVLKRFSDGTYYEDFFIKKLIETVKDYEMDGVHLADAIIPQRWSIRYGDFSDDMLNQFVAHTGVKLPDDIGLPIDNKDYEHMKKRRVYIWNRHREEWILFMSWRWYRFFKKVCDAMHSAGKKVMANNCWCTEPFEALYRYGVDYRKLQEAGLDYLLVEDQATAAYVASGDPNNKVYHMHKFMTMTMMIRAFMPDTGLLSFNGVRDSTEEWNMITHMPCGLEREIYSLQHYMQYKKGILKRSSDGFLVCLADGMTSEQWKWLDERYAIAFDVTPECPLTPVMVWSDSLVYKFLPEYIKTRRWSPHKIIYEFSKAGGQIAASVRIEELKYISGPIFVPNIDVLPIEEQRIIEEYDKGPIICTSLSDKMFTMPGGKTPDFFLEDPFAAKRMCIMVYNMPYINYEAVTSELGKDDGIPDISTQPEYAEDPENWTDDMIYCKVSGGFVKACARLLRSLYVSDIDAEMDELVLPFKMKDGRIRLYIANDIHMKYKQIMLRSICPIKSIETSSKFPALPPKLITNRNEIIVPEKDDDYNKNIVVGFVAKIPPSGMTIYDVILRDK